MHKLKLPAFVLLLMVLCIPLFTAAQQVTGRVEGSITSAGSVLPGVRVLLEATGVTTQVKLTDAKGNFAFVAAPGRYAIRANLDGFAPVTQPVEVRAKSTTHVAFSMQPQAILENLAMVSEAMAPTSRGRVSGGVAGGVVGGFGSYAAKTRPMAPPPPLAYPGGALIRRNAGDLNTEAYDRIDEGAFKRVTDNPLSTFSVDVDTASYANTRRFLNDGSLPPADAVRIEELINYFSYDYPQPRDEAPFSVTMELAPCPWNPANRLALVGLKGRNIDQRELPARNLVFLIDVSGSMDEPMKLPLLKTGMRMLVDQLTARDHVAIVVYAGASGLALPSTSGDSKATIHQAIEELQPGGSTNGAEGITLAYKIAGDNFVKGAVNRVILATDGDFNVGVTSEGELVRLIEEKRATGISLSVLGFGTGNLKDATMEKLADKGNGNYSYIDSLHEARKVLVSEAGGTLVTIAKDVKLQLEFNPRAVAEYRLIGYENRVLAAEDFNDDKKDAGEIGAGHSVTALYEIVPAGGSSDTRPGGTSAPPDAQTPTVDPLKYQEARRLSGASGSAELLTLKLRYKAPDGDVSKLIEAPLRNEPHAMTANLGFAAGVAEFGMLLRASDHKGNATFATAIDLAKTFRGTDASGYRAELVRLMELAQSLTELNKTSQR